MKKNEYIAPEMEIVEIETQSIMQFASESPTQKPSTEPNPDGGDDKWAD